MYHPPTWLNVRSPTVTQPQKIAGFSGLDEGETEALHLAVILQASLILMDDRAGVAAARGAGFTVTGTLGVLYLAAQAGMTDLAGSMDKLRATNFRCRSNVMANLLAMHLANRGKP